MGKRTRSQKHTPQPEERQPRRLVILPTVFEVGVAPEAADGSGGRMILDYATPVASGYLSFTADEGLTLLRLIAEALGVTVEDKRTEQPATDLAVVEGLVGPDGRKL